MLRHPLAQAWHHRAQVLAGVGPWIWVVLWVGVVLWVLVGLAGADFLESIEAFFNGAFGGRRFAYLFSTLSRTALIAGMALSVMISFRAGQLNIGGEGQLVAGGLAAAVAAVHFDAPGPSVMLATIMAGIVAGALWAALAGILQVSMGVPLLVGSLLLNYPIRYFASYVVNHPLRDVDSGMAQTHLIAHDAWLPLIPGTRLDVGIFVIVVLSLLAIGYSYRTVHGFRARLVGLSPEFARASGLRVERLALETIMISGAIAGLVGAIAVLGTYHRFSDGMLVQPLYAWTAIIAVLLVNMIPWAVPLSAFFFAAVHTGAAGTERTAGVPKEIAIIIQAVLILFIASRSVSNTHPAAQSPDEDAQDAPKRESK